MNRTLGILQFATVALYATIANSSRFNPALMPWLSAGAFIVVGFTLLKVYRHEGQLPAISGAIGFFFLLNAVGFALRPGGLDLLLSAYLTGTLYLCLLSFTLLPALLAGSHFTEYFARKSAPPEVWETPPFKAINRNMTYAWTGLFALGALLCAVPVLAGWRGLGVELALRLLFQVVLPLSLVLGVGVTFTRRYPAHYLKKLGLDPALAAKLPEEEKEPPMAGEYVVVAINGSPKGAVGNTSRMVNMVGEALSGHGVKLKEVFLSEHHIEYCVGCGHCLEKNRCWRNDDHRALVEELMAADGVILASPVYFGQVTAQMKTFIDRALTFGHKPATDWKPGLAISVSAGKGESETGRYLGRVLHPFGAFPVGTFTAIAVGPGQFTGIEHVRLRAADLARDIAVAIREKRRYPATDEDFSFYLFMRELVSENRAFMAGDYKHWQEKGLLENFAAYSGQTVSKSEMDPSHRAEWIKELARREKSGGKAPAPKPEQTGSPLFGSCRELLNSMPLGFDGARAGDFKAVYQFEITGGEVFEGYLTIGDGRCSFTEGRAAKADITITSPSDIWLSIASGELPGQAAFMAGKFKVKGDLGLLMRMKELFPGRPGGAHP